MDTYRWAEGVSVTTAKAFKKGLLFFLLFSFVSSFWRRARLSGRKNFIGYKQMGFGLFAKDGVYWIWGGLGAKYRTYKMWHRLWGWVCFFSFLFVSFFPSFKIDFAGIFSDLLDRLGVRFVRILSTIFDIPASTRVIPGEVRNKKSVGIKRLG